MLCAKLSKFRNLSKLGSIENTGKVLQLLVINGDYGQNIQYWITLALLTRLTKPKVVSAKQTENQAITCANQQEPNQNWGSNFPNSPSSSVFKCRSYRSSFGIWIQAAQTYDGGSLTAQEFREKVHRDRLYYYVEGLGHNLFSVGQFCDSDMEVAFRKHYVKVNDTELVVELINVLEVLICSLARCEAHDNVSPFALLFKASKNNIMLTEQMALAPYVPPTNKELKILFQTMFDEYLQPPRAERPISPAPAVSVPVNSAGTPSSTTIDQDAPSPSHSPSSSALQSPSLHQGVAD
ncbi:hypothetical protein Tco_1043048 [Tanacetum coccineum]|uniref:Uncharacterized protein n=1 Tax=Tanacetum coccineum TaxID=301880 RepID=A0ABQ5GLB2_9ASTR